MLGFFFFPCLRSYCERWKEAFDLDLLRSMLKNATKCSLFNLFSSPQKTLVNSTDLSLDYVLLLQVSVFMNLPSLMSRTEWMDQVLDIATKAVDSERVEIREKAGQFLSGLLHCDFISETKKQELLVST